MSRPDPDPFANLKTAISLRAGSLAAFPVGAIALAVLERGWLAIGALALAMLAVSLLERRRFGRALGVAVPTGTSAVVTGLAVRFGLLTGLFVVTVGVLALFRDTALSRALGWPDAAVIALSTGGALLANALSSRLAPLSAPGRAPAGKPGRPAPKSAPAEGVVLEGEIIDKDPSP